MTDTTTTKTILSDVLKALISIGDITTTKVDEITTALFKDEIPFCLVTDEGIYFRSDEEAKHLLFQDRKFCKTALSPAKRDDFLKSATESYWIASGRW